MLICIWSLKKIEKVDFSFFLKDIVKPTINKFYDPKHESKFIIYSIFKFLSTGELQWTGPKNLNSSIGCVLEIDFEYPKELRIKNYN